MTAFRSFNRRFFYTIITWGFSRGTGLNLSDRYGFPEACPARSCSFTATDKGLCFFHICRHRKSRLVVRTHRLSAHILEEIHLCWLQLLWVPALVGGRAWIPPLPPSLILVSLQKPTWSAIFSSLAMQCAHSISPDVSRSHSYHWWGCHCHQLKLQGRAVKSNCCWIVS